MNSEQLNGDYEIYFTKIYLSQNQGFYEILTLWKFGAIQYLETKIQICDVRN